jgi:hypothetical protein
LLAHGYARTEHPLLGRSGRPLLACGRGSSAGCRWLAVRARRQLGGNRRGQRWPPPCAGQGRRVAAWYCAAAPAPDVASLSSGNAHPSGVRPFRPRRGGHRGGQPRRDRVRHGQASRGIWCGRDARRHWCADRGEGRRAAPGRLRRGRARPTSPGNAWSWTAATPSPSSAPHPPRHLPAPGRCQNSATVVDLGFYAARSYVSAGATPASSPGPRSRLYGYSRYVVSKLRLRNHAGRRMAEVISSLRFAVTPLGVAGLSPGTWTPGPGNCRSVRHPSAGCARSGRVQRPLSCQ